MLSETLNPEEIDPPFAKKTGLPPEWIVAPSPVPYPEALAFMEARVAAIAAGEAREMVWLVEHPPLYTAGVSAKRKT
jgi:lipoyl(octanoyl) transferase